MQAIIHQEGLIWTIQNFLSPKECDDLIQFSEMRGYEEAEVQLSGGSKMMKNIRNNERILYTDFELASRYWEKLKPFCPASLDNAQAIGLNEQFRFYKYSKGQRFKKHKDGRFQRDEKEVSRITFMIYLNEGYEGGETKFENITIIPKTGDALCFIHELKHEGSELIAGQKYVLRSDVMYRDG